ncbi:MAG: TraR/DksA C4-type zinc finger protein [Acidimicrobiales bacterium]
MSAEHTEARTLAASLREQLDDVDRALGKLDDGTYGSCEVCGATIPDERLAAMPATPCFYRARRLDALDGALLI